MPLIFLHINKTAGTSLRAVVERNYSGAELLLLYPNRIGMPLEAFHSLSPDKKAQFSVVYGHVSYGIHKHWDTDSSYYCILRDPIERTLSTFAHHLRNPLSEELHRLPEEQRSIERFLDLKLVGTDNLMTRMLSGISHIAYGQCNASHLERACENLDKHFAMVLFQETLARDVRSLGERLGWAHREVPMLNTSKNRILREQCSPEVHARLKELNDLDKQLYAYAKKASPDRT